MERAVVDGSEISGCDSAVTVNIKLSESLVDVDLSGFVGASTESDEEFIVVNETVLVGIKVFNENLSLALRDVDSHVFDAPVKFLFVEGSVTTVVHNLEDTSHSSDGLSTSACKADSDLIENCTMKNFNVEGLTAFVTDLNYLLSTGLDDSMCVLN